MSTNITCFWQRLVNNTRAQEDLRADLGRRLATSARAISSATCSADHERQPDTPEDYVNHSLYFEAKTFLHGLLVVEDKLSMAHSLETRVPFLDNDLVDFAMQLPGAAQAQQSEKVIRIDENEPGAKQARFFQKTQDGKQILRDVMSGFIPRTSRPRRSRASPLPTQAGSRATASIS